MGIHLVYLHGWQSSNYTQKGWLLNEHFSQIRKSGYPAFTCDFDTPYVFCSTCHEHRFLDPKGVRVHCLNANRGDSARGISITGTCDVLDRFFGAVSKEDPTTKLVIIGSSFGGFMAAWYAAKYPERVQRIIMLNPGIGGARRLLSKSPPPYYDTDLKTWQRTGEAMSYLGPVDWAFGREMLAFGCGLPLDEEPDFRRVPHVEFPTFSCPGVCIHGMHDAVVPHEDAWTQFSLKANVELVSINDDHDMLRPRSLEILLQVSAEFLGISTGSEMTTYYDLGRLQESPTEWRQGFTLGKRLAAVGFAWDRSHLRASRKTDGFVLRTIWQSGTRVVHEDLADDGSYCCRFDGELPCELLNPKSH